jgi:hypothetical protein
MIDHLIKFGCLEPHLQTNDNLKHICITLPCIAYKMTNLIKILSKIYKHTVLSFILTKLSMNFLTTLSTSQSTQQLKPFIKHYPITLEPIHQSH